MAKLSKKELLAAYKELDEVVGVEPPIEYENDEQFAQELYDTVAEIVTEEDEFSKKTQAVFDALKEQFEDDDADDDDTDDDDEEEEPVKPVKKGKPAPEPVKPVKKGKPAPEPEDDDDDEEEEEPAPKKGKEKEKPAKKEKKEKAAPNFKREGSMAVFVDEVLEKGGTWEVIVEKCKAEAEKRGKNVLATKNQIVSHAKFRISKGKTWKLTDAGVNLKK